MHETSTESPSNTGGPGTLVSSRSRWVDRLAGLVQILQPEVNVCVLRRPPATQIAGYLNAVTRAGLCFDVRRVVLPDTPVDGLLPGPPGPGREALLADVAQLLDVFATLTDAPRLGVRFESLSSAMCPRLHVDRVGLRLLCTYRGPGTQWLDDPGADRSKLGLGARHGDDQASGLLRDRNMLCEMAPFHVGLLKGEAWPGNAGHGAIHRSPAVSLEESPRILLSVDAVWD